MAAAVAADEDADDGWDNAADDAAYEDACNDEAAGACGIDMGMDGSDARYCCPLADSCCSSKSNSFDGAAVCDGTL